MLIVDSVYCQMQYCAGAKFGIFLGGGEEGGLAPVAPEKRLKFKDLTCPVGGLNPHSYPPLNTPLELCTVIYLLCYIHCALCTVSCELCTVLHCVLCTMHRALWPLSRKFKKYRLTKLLSFLLWGLKICVEKEIEIIKKLNNIIFRKQILVANRVSNTLLHDDTLL